MLDWKDNGSEGLGGNNMRVNLSVCMKNCKNPKLKVQVEAAILKYYGCNYDKIKTYICDIAHGFGTIKEGTQAQRPVTVEQLQGLGLMGELK